MGQSRGVSDLMSEEEVAAPPGYGQHMLDQLYEDVGFGGFQTPENQSGTNSPYYQRSALQSALTSQEDLTVMRDANPDMLTAALATRLQRVTETRRSRRNSVVSLESDEQHPHSEALSRQTSNEEPPSSPETAEHIDDSALLGNLNKVPSYATALRTPARPRSMFGVAMVLPMYEDIGPESANSSDAAHAFHVRPSRAAAAGSRVRAVSLATGREGYERGSSARGAGPARSGSVRRGAERQPLSEGQEEPEREGSQAPVAAESSRPQTARAHPMSGFPEALVQRLSGHGYANNHHRLAAPRPYLAAGQDLQCI